MKYLTSIAKVHINLEPSVKRTSPFLSFCAESSMSIESRNYILWQKQSIH